MSVTGWTPGRSLRTWRWLTYDFRMEPRGGREHRQVLLFSRMQPLNEQEATCGDAEGVRFLVGHLAACCRGTAQVDLDSHDRAPFVGSRISTPCHGTRAAAGYRQSRDRLRRQLLPEHAPRTAPPGKVSAEAAMRDPPPSSPQSHQPPAR